MFLVDQLIFLAGALLFIGIASSKASMRLGLPVLVLFLFVGMLAGEEGLGGIVFDDFVTAHAIGTIALAVILFDGGLRTDLGSLRIAWKPSFFMATIGVLGTAIVTGVAAAYILDVPLLTGLLLGSIVASTDAAAVFAVLRSQGLRLRRRIAATLEIESGSNDPMAIFLTIGLIQVIRGDIALGVDVIWLFVQQMGIGAVAGFIVGWTAVLVINRINLQAAGLYPVLTGAFGLLAFGIAAVLGGSGFLSIYLAGIVLGNRRLTFQRGTLLFLDGVAWVSQITMFVVLGLLSTPTSLLAVAPAGLAIAAVLVLVSRPVIVVPILVAFKFTAREQLLVAWVGLKGSVPIILATFPLLFAVDYGGLLFNVVFFVVLVSAVLQGWTLPLLASRLGLEDDAAPEAPVTLDITGIHTVGAEIVDYSVSAASWVAGRPLSDLALPDGVVIAMISRAEQLIPPRGSTEVLPGDHVFVVIRPENRDRVDQVFTRTAADSEGRDPLRTTAPVTRA